MKSRSNGLGYGEVIKVPTTEPHKVRVTRRFCPKGHDKLTLGVTAQGSCKQCGLHGQEIERTYIRGGPRGSWMKLVLSDLEKTA